MKFFSNLPKKPFNSTIGKFTISDFFTFLNVTSPYLETGKINIDNVTTLVEASYASYNDPNGFWTFLVSNKTINPFDLLETNVEVFIEENQEKLSILVNQESDGVTTGLAFPVGSYLVPYIGNTGSSASYGSTGNFNLNGQFAIVEESSFYDGSMVVSQYGTPFITVSNVPVKTLVIQKNNDGSYSWVDGVPINGITYGPGFYVTSAIVAYDRIVAVVDPNDAKTDRKQPTSSKYTPDQYVDKFPPLTGATFAVTALDVAEDVSKEITAYSPSALGTVQSSFITAKYI